MNFDDYEKKREAVYAEFVEIVKFVLETAILETSGVPRPQSIQGRAKSAASLKPKLRNRDLLESDSIEKEIKDLAGARLIFYTNTDVDRFLNSRLIPQHFEVDWKETKIHHPTSENAQRRYQAIHYTVYLSAERIALPEYAKFKGMRCLRVVRSRAPGICASIFKTGYLATESVIAQPRESSAPRRPS